MKKSLYTIDSHTLFKFSLEALQSHGWLVERVPLCGKSSLRRISKGEVSHVACIRTSQNGSIGFPLDKVGGWVTLSNAQIVVVASIDAMNPDCVKVHFFDARKVEEQFNRRYLARKDANHKLSPNHSIWLSLYSPDDDDLPSHVGNGIGLNPETIIARETLKEISTRYHLTKEPVDGVALEEPLTIAEAKKRLASTFSVTIDAVKISISM
jgi:hypothetical protein